MSPALRDGFLTTGLPGKPGPAPIHLALLAAPHDYSLWPHRSRLFPSLGLSSSIDRPVYILALLQVQVKAQPQDAFQDISSLTPFFIDLIAVFIAPFSEPSEVRHHHGVLLQGASKGDKEARVTTYE